MSKIKDGEYILATRFSDGDPMDPWAFGFLKRCVTPNMKDAYIVYDEYGMNIGPIYQRAQRISMEFGHWLFNNIKFVEQSGRSLWWWKQHYQEYPNRTRAYHVGGKV